MSTTITTKHFSFRTCFFYLLKPLHAPFVIFHEMPWNCIDICNYFYVHKQKKIYKFSSQDTNKYILLFDIFTNFYEIVYINDTQIRFFFVEQCILILCTQVLFYIIPVV